jgi:Collagen triple helix repeat (20 copies)
LTFRNAWNVATSYQIGDAVSYSGSSYISLSGSNTGNTPSNGARWALLAQQGSTGATGATGSVESVGPAGANGTNGTNGTNGMNGMMGAAGPMGPAGRQSTLIAARYNAGVPGTSYANYLFANSNESAVFLAILRTFPRRLHTQELCGYHGSGDTQRCNIDSQSANQLNALPCRSLDYG